jgi:hypothetical protein
MEKLLNDGKQERSCPVGKGQLRLTGIKVS